jgi:hypothetical protein
MRVLLIVTEENFPQRFFLKKNPRFFLLTAPLHYDNAVSLVGHGLSKSNMGLVNQIAVVCRIMYGVL